MSKDSKTLNHKVLIASLRGTDLRFMPSGGNGFPCQCTASVKCLNQTFKPYVTPRPVGLAVEAVARFEAPHRAEHALCLVANPKMAAAGRLSHRDRLHSYISMLQLGRSIQGWAKNFELRWSTE